MHVLSLSGTNFAEGLAVRVRIPKYQTRGSDARLVCLYSLEGDILYSLKWYKGEQLFYQFIPEHQNQKTIFSIEGIEIDVSNLMQACVNIYCTNWV